MDLTNETLIQRICSKQDDDTWKEFDATYRSYIIAFVNRMGLSYHESQDLCQIIMVKLWKGLPRFQYKRGECRFRTWLITVSRNAIRDYVALKQNKMRKQTDSGLEIDYPVTADIEKITQQEWEVFIYKKAWDNVKTQFSESVLKAFNLSAQKVPNQQIADELGLASSSIYTYRHRVETALKKEILRLNDELS